MFVDLMNLVECIHSSTSSTFSLFLVIRNTVAVMLLHTLLNNIQNLTLRHNITDLNRISWAMLSLDTSSRLLLIHFQDVLVNVRRIRWLKATLQLGSLREFIAARNEALTMINTCPEIVLGRSFGGFFILRKEATEIKVLARFRLFAQDHLRIYLVLLCVAQDLLRFLGSTFIFGTRVWRCFIGGSWSLKFFLAYVFLSTWFGLNNPMNMNF